jgi:hypothetical protein
LLHFRIVYTILHFEIKNLIFFINIYALYFLLCCLTIMISVIEPNCIISFDSHAFWINYHLHARGDWNWHAQQMQ